MTSRDLDGSILRLQFMEIIRSCYEQDTLPVSKLIATKSELVGYGISEESANWIIDTILNSSIVVNQKISRLEAFRDGQNHALELILSTQSPTFVAIQNSLASSESRGTIMSTHDEKNINYGNVGNQGGRNNEAQIGSMSQTGNQIDSTIDWSQVADELGRIRAAMSTAESDDPDHHFAEGAVRAAEAAARKGDGNKALQYLKSSGKFVADFASKVGSGLILELLKSHLGLPSH